MKILNAEYKGYSAKVSYNVPRFNFVDADHEFKLNAYKLFVFRELINNLQYDTPCLLNKSRINISFHYCM